MKRMVVALLFALAWSDTFQSRVEVLALLQSLNGEILAGSSATRTLETWCGEARTIVCSVMGGCSWG